MKKLVTGFLMALLAVAVHGATYTNGQTIIGVNDTSDTAVSVAGAVKLSGDNVYSAARLTFADNASLVLADGQTAATLRVKDFAVGANVTIGAGVTLVGDFVSQTVKGKTFTVNGVVKSSAQIYSDTGLSIFSGTGTIWADNLAVRNANQRALDNSGAGQLTFYNHRVNLRGTGANKSIIDRQWGHYRFQNAVFGFWGQDTKWQRAGEGTRQTRIVGQNGRIAFDTLDAEDGVTPRTFTWSGTSVLPDVGVLTVVKTNPGTMIVEFNLGAYLTSGVVVEGGTMRYTANTVTLGAQAKVEGGRLEIPNASATVTDLELAGGTLALTINKPLTVNGTCSISSASTIEVSVPSATLNGEYPVIYGFGAADVSQLNFANGVADSTAICQFSVKNGNLMVTVGGQLSWKGGNGNWSDVNWLNGAGETVAWSDDHLADFPDANAGTVTVDTAVSASAIAFGDGYTLVAGAGSVTVPEVSVSGTLRLSGSPFGGQTGLKLNPNAEVAAVANGSATLNLSALGLEDGIKIGEGLALNLATGLTIDRTLQLEFDGAVTVAGGVSVTADNVVVGGTGSLAANGDLSVAAGKTLSWGVGSSRFTGGIALQGSEVKLTFASGSTRFEADWTANMSSANPRAIFTVAEGAKVDVKRMHSSYIYYWVVNGELIAHDLISVSPGTNGDWFSGTGTASVVGLSIMNHSQLGFKVPQLHVGAAGLCVSNYNGACGAHFGGVATTIAPASSDFAFFSDGCTYFEGSHANNTATVIDTVDTNGVARTVTFSMALGGAGEFAVKGNGTFIMEPYASSFTGAAKVEDGATLLLRKSIGGCSEFTVGDGGTFKVEAASLALPHSMVVQTNGVLATAHPITVSGVQFNAGAVIRPLRSSFEDPVPVIKISDTATFPSSGELVLDLSETLVGQHMTQIVDWSEAGAPAGFRASQVRTIPVAGHMNSYNVKVNANGLYVGLTGVWIFIR